MLELPQARLSHLITTVFLALACCRSPALAQPSVTSSERPAGWAKPLEVQGVPNLFRVNVNLYRGAQPTREGFANLGAMGIKTIVNLRSFHSDRDLLPPGVAYVNIPMKGWHVESEDLVRFLEVANDPERQPVFVHCQRGADRTGLVCAVYRITAEGWTNDRAVEEMRDGGYGFWPGWANITKYLERFSVEKLRSQDTD